MKDYFRITRSPWHSFVFVLPLLLLYEATVLLANAGMRYPVVNGADALLYGTLRSLGVGGVLGSSLVLAVVAGIAVYFLDPEGRRGGTRFRLFPGVLAESSVYALVLGTLVAFLTSLLLSGGGLLQIGGGSLNFGQRLALSLGAGLYEELVFRLLLTGGLAWLFRKLLPKKTGSEAGLGTPVALAVLVSALIFSGFHYLGAYGDPFQLGSFTFRFIAGLVLAALFAVRGFAVAAWTHALYDVFLVFAGRA
ncbi:MAG: CPBP family intramembrane glutamic endopeptidase [Armatimonadota bacterium]